MVTLPKNQQKLIFFYSVECEDYNGNCEDCMFVTGECLWCITGNCIALDDTLTCSATLSLSTCPCKYRRNSFIYREISSSRYILPRTL